MKKVIASLLVVLTVMISIPVAIYAEDYNMETHIPAGTIFMQKGSYIGIYKTETGEIYDQNNQEMPAGTEIATRIIEVKFYLKKKYDVEGALAYTKNGVYNFERDAVYQLGIYTRGLQVNGTESWNQDWMNNYVIQIPGGGRYVFEKLKISGTGNDTELSGCLVDQSITVEVGNQERYYDTENYIKMTEKKYIGNAAGTRIDWSFWAPDQRFNNTYAGAAAYEPATGAAYKFIYMYSQSGNTVYLNPDQFEDLLASGGGGGGGGGISTARWEELMDTINAAETVVEINDKMDDVIELLGQTLDSNTAQAIADQATQVEETTTEAIEQESEFTDDMKDKLDAINPSDYTGILSNSKFVSTMNWIRNVHLQTVEQTELGGVVTLILIIGLAVYLIGRRAG